MIREKKLRSPANVQLNTRLTTRMRLHNTLFIFDLSSLTAFIASTQAGLRTFDSNSKFHFNLGITSALMLPVTVAFLLAFSSKRLTKHG